MTDTNPSPRRPEYWPVERIADMLGVTPRSVRTYVSKGFFTGYRIPGTRGIRLNPDEVRRAMKAIPTTVSRTAVNAFGPNAKIIDLPPQPRRIMAEPEGSNQ